MVVIKTDGTQIEARDIYNDTTDFLYIIDLGGYWKAIRKDEIKSLEYKRQPPMLQTKIEKMSIVEWRALTVTFALICMFIAFYFTVPAGFNIYLTGLFIFGLIVLIFDHFILKKRMIKEN